MREPFVPRKTVPALHEGQFGQVDLSDARIRRRAGEDDVLQSIFASFFAAAPGPDGPPRSRADLWRQLVHFTMCKVANTADRHRARRRDGRRERPLGGIEADESAPEPVWAEPEDLHRMSAEDEAVACEEFLLAEKPALPQPYLPGIARAWAEYRQEKELFLQIGHKVWVIMRV